MQEEMTSDSDGPLIDDNVIRIQLRKPHKHKWELRTRNHSPSITFPIIQLFDCDGNLLVETNDENISIKKDYDDCELKRNKSLHSVGKSKDISSLRRSKTLSDKVYTRIYKPVLKEKNQNTPEIFAQNKLPLRYIDNKDYLKQCYNSEPISETSSFKSSDNESSSNKENNDDKNNNTLETAPTNCFRIVDENTNYDIPIKSTCKTSKNEYSNENNNTITPIELKRYNEVVGIHQGCKFCTWDSSEYTSIPTDVAADCEFKKRLKMYRRGISEVEHRSKTSRPIITRTLSLSASMKMLHSSSSESVDEADLVLNRLKRRILKNKSRDRKRSLGCQNRPCLSPSTSESSHYVDDVVKRHAVHLKDRRKMGANISQHSSKGLKGRRARSSGDLCNGDNKSPPDSPVCGSVVGDVLGWNRSLPNHLDGNRHLADYSRVNNCGEFVTYNRRPKGGRGLRYRIFNSGTEKEPVWKLQDPGCDQGYGSERSPEEDYAPSLEPNISMDEYESQLRTAYPFITDDNTYTVVVEKDGRGLGMSVCGGGGLVRIRRLYPPLPAWRTGRLAPRDLLLAANGVPLAGLSTYEALEVLRTTASRVELRVCRPPPDVIESVTPPDPPTPPARTPHPPDTPLPPLDPLNCHPLHTRLSATNSSATNSSSEGRTRREDSPDARRDLTLPGLDKPLPVFDVQYGDGGVVEFDIVMTKVNRSLGFTLRKEDHSALGHYVRALVREPALSDGRILPGDRIVAVNDTPMSNLSHAEAVAFLRSCGSEVKLRLYRDHAATPLSPTSPKDEGPTDSDTPIHKPKLHLRAEAVSMLCDLAARRLTPDATDGSRSPCLSPRKFRRLTKESNHYEVPHDRSATKFSLDSLCIDGCTDVIVQEIKPKQRTRSANTVFTEKRKKKISFAVPSDSFHLHSIDKEHSSYPNIYHEDRNPRFPEPLYCDTHEPISMPLEHSSDETGFQYSNPAYQSAVLHSSTANEDSSDGKCDGKGLKKWKGVTLSPDCDKKTLKSDIIQKENLMPSSDNDTSNEPTIVTVELNRGWNSRLGFSVQSHPDSGQSYISAVYNDSVAARDGRLQRGDVILQVNDENVTSMKTPEVIDLLRILRGSICITVLRPPSKP